jgi:His/Glu/Gln/Arg/opine family amino acid ABC transporter permease subunit
VGVAKSQSSFLARGPATLFVEVFRSVPILILLIWIYYGLAIVFNISFTPFTAGVIGLGLFYGAFLAETFRAGIQAISHGQREAAFMLGLNRWQTLYSVVLPQAFRVVIPPLANSYVGMIKDATLVSVLGLTEIMRAAQTVVYTTYRPFEVYTFVAAVYLVLTFVFGRAIGFVERRARTT